MRKHIIALVVLVAILMASRLHASNASNSPTQPDRWIDDLFAHGIQVEVWEDGSGLATEPETGTVVEFCIREMLCDNFTQLPVAGMQSSSVEHWITEFFATGLTVTIYEDGSGIVTGYEDVTLEFCVLDMPCGPATYNFYYYFPIVSQ